MIAEDSKSEVGPDRRRIGIGLALIALAATRFGPSTLDALGFVGSQIVAALRPSRRGTPLGLEVADAIFELCRIGWPAALGLMIAIGKKPGLARAASLTALILCAESITSSSGTSGRGIAPGAWRLSALGLIRGLLELGLAVAAWRAADRARPELRSARGGRGAPAAVEARLAIVGALTFAVCVFGLKIWDGYNALIASDARVRRMVLFADRFRPAAPPRPETQEMKHLHDAELALRNAQSLAGRGLYQDAIAAYREGLAHGDRVRSLPRIDNASGLEYQAALIRNNLAWLLVTCPDTKLRNPVRAESLARSVVKLLPGEGNYWNTLGLALYRAGKLGEAASAIEESMKLRNGGDGYDWYILAMIRQGLGDQDAARKVFEKAEARSREYPPIDSDLLDLRAEASAALGLGEAPPIPTKSTDRRGRPRNIGSGPATTIRAL